jgi:hypothetical protein
LAEHTRAVMTVKGNYRYACWPAKSLPSVTTHGSDGPDLLRPETYDTPLSDSKRSRLQAESMLMVTGNHRSFKLRYLRAATVKQASKKVDQTRLFRNLATRGKTHRSGAKRDKKWNQCGLFGLSQKPGEHHVCATSKVRLLAGAASCGARTSHGGRSGVWNF